MTRRLLASFQDDFGTADDFLWGCRHRRLTLTGRFVGQAVMGSRTAPLFPARLGLSASGLRKQT